MKTITTIEITIAVDADADEHLQDEQAIRDEVRSWLEGLGATVVDLRVQTHAPEPLKDMDGGYYHAPPDDDEEGGSR